MFKLIQNTDYSMLQNLKSKKQQTWTNGKTGKQSPTMKPTLVWWGGLSNQEVFPSVSTKGASQSNATLFNQNKQIFYILMPRT